MTRPDGSSLPVLILYPDDNFSMAPDMPRADEENWRLVLMADMLWATTILMIIPPCCKGCSFHVPGCLPDNPSVAFASCTAPHKTVFWATKCGKDWYGTSREPHFAQLLPLIIHAVKLNGDNKSYVAQKAFELEETKQKKAALKAARKHGSLYLCGYFGEFW